MILPNKNILKVKIKWLMSLLILTATFNRLSAQNEFKIGTNPGNINVSAVFEAESTTKGILFPRMTTANMNAIASPVTGLMIYNTDDGCIYVFRATWISTCSTTYALAWGLTGNAATIDGTNFMGTTDNTPLSIRVNNQQEFKINTNFSFQRDAGGNARGSYATDWQRGRSAATQVASGSSSVIGGGGGNTASANLSTVVGGNGNTANNTGAFVGGGNVNTASGNLAGVVGGNSNTSSGSYAFIGGGSGNMEIGRAHV